MTIRDAIELLQRRKLYMSMGFEGNEAEWVKDNNVAIDMAVSALEKQIAKPPRESEGYDADGFWRPDMFFCPTCEKSIGPFEHHCDCGQRIDWGDKYA